MKLRRKEAGKYEVSGTFRQNGEEVFIEIVSTFGVWQANVRAKSGRFLDGMMRNTKGWLVEELPAIMRHWNVEEV